MQYLKAIFLVIATRTLNEPCTATDPPPAQAAWRRARATGRGHAIPRRRQPAPCMHLPASSVEAVYTTPLGAYTLGAPCPPRCLVCQPPPPRFPHCSLPPLHPTNREAAQAAADGGVSSEAVRRTRTVSSSPESPARSSCLPHLVRLGGWCSSSTPRLKQVIGRARVLRTCVYVDACARTLMDILVDPPPGPGPAYHPAESLEEGKGQNKNKKSVFSGLDDDSSLSAYACVRIKYGKPACPDTPTI